MRKVVSFFLVFILSFLLVTSKVSAKMMADETGTVIVAKDEIINDDLFINAQTAEIMGIVNGDVFIGAQNIKITGTINGSLYVGGLLISLSGVVKGNTYLGGQQIDIAKGNFGGSVFAGGQNINIGQDVVITGSLYAGGSSTMVDSRVDRNVYLGTNILNVGDNTIIGKDLYYAGQVGKTTISETAQIKGVVHKSMVQVPEQEMKRAQRNFPQAIRKFGIVTNLISFISAIIIGFIYLKFFSNHFKETSETVVKDFWKSLGVGFLTAIAFIPGFIVLLVTVIGIPIAGLALLILFIFLYMSKIVVGMALGNLLVKKFEWKLTPFNTFALGLLAVYVIKMIPIIGGFTGCIIMLTGLGGLVLTIKQQNPASKK